jgi:hypothetical protein
MEGTPFVAGIRVLVLLLLRNININRLVHIVLPLLGYRRWRHGRSIGLLVGSGGDIASRVLVTVDVRGFVRSLPSRGGFASRIVVTIDVRGFVRSLPSRGSGIASRVVVTVDFRGFVRCLPSIGAGAGAGAASRSVRIAILGRGELQNLKSKQKENDGLGEKYRA